MSKAYLAVLVSLLIVACTTSSEVRMPSEPAMTPTDAASFAREAKFIVNKPVSTIPENKTQPKDGYLEVIATVLRSDLKKYDRLASEESNAPTIDIEVTEFRMRSDATREIFGVLAGKDGIVSQVTVRDPSGAALGTMTVGSKNITSYGGEWVVKEHGREISKALREKLQEIESGSR